MGAKMQHGIGTEIFAQPAIKMRERMGRCKPTLKQHPHGVAFVAHGGLNPHQHVAKRFAQHKKVLTVGPFLTRCGPPLGLDLCKPGLCAHVVIHWHALEHVGLSAKLLCIALQDRVPQFGVGIGEVDVVTLIPHRRERIE